MSVFDFMFNILAEPIEPAIAPVAHRWVTREGDDFPIESISNQLFPPFPKPFSFNPFSPHV